MKVMIGTMYMGEGDFDRCKEMVARQDIEHEHVIIKDLPEAKAHETLYRTFKDGRFSYLVKVDADTVMTDESVCSDLINLMRNRYDRVSFWVKDFYTQDYMSAIHCYDRRVNWDWSRFAEGNLHPDRTDNSKIARTYKEVRGLHCYYATPLQSFHFGFHRVKKGQMARILQIVKHFKECPHDNLRWAIIGGLVATEAKVNYTGYDGLDELLEQNRSRDIDLDKIHRKFR